METEKREGVAEIVMKSNISILVHFFSHCFSSPEFSIEQATNEEIPERCTEKLVDLVFVLATKLDLNVNDMRELMESSLKDQALKFESMTNKVNDNFQTLNNEIDKLKEENRIQNEKISQLSSNHEIASKDHLNLFNNFNLLNADYNKTVVEDHGTRLNKAESSLSNLEDNVSRLRKEMRAEHAQSVKKMESLETDILDKMEANGKSLDSKWLKRNDEMEEKRNRSETSINDKLNGHDSRIALLDEKVAQNNKTFLEYKDLNEGNIREIKDILLSNSEGDQQLQEDFDECKKFVNQLNDQFLKQTEDYTNRLHQMSSEQTNLSQTFTDNRNENQDHFLRVHDEINETNDKLEKVRTAFNSHKSNSETQNRRNNEDHEKIECSLQRLNESKNSLEKEIEHLKADCRTNEKSRKTNEKSQTDRCNILSENQTSHFNTLTKLETDLRLVEEKIKLENKRVCEEFKKTDIKFKDKDEDLKHSMKSFAEQMDISASCLQEKVKEDMDAVHDSVSENLEDLKSKVNTLINCDIASSTR